MLSLHSLLTLNYLTIIRLNLMAINSFNQIYIHFVIVVKDRAKLITPTLEPVLYKYISSIIENRKNKKMFIPILRAKKNIIRNVLPKKK